MSVRLYFGLPGCGKTTLMTALAMDAIKKKRYRNIYCNVRISVHGVTYIPNDVIGKYGLEDALILIDEASIYADNRDHKNFTKEQVTYFLEHRHFNVDIYMFTQQWDGVDRKIRVITDRVYYVYKPFLTGLWWSKYYRIPYGIIIPDPKKNESQKLGEIIQGYCKPNFFLRLFAPSIFRPKYYPFYDSWERPAGFPPLPDRYKPYYESVDQISSKRKASKSQKYPLRNISYILLRSFSKLRSSGKELIHRAAHFFSSVFRKLSSSN